MAPAAQITGTLLDPAGAPIKNKRVGLTGDSLPPSSSVFAEVKTNDRGEFTFKNLPTTFPLKLYTESETKNWRQWPALTIKLINPKPFTFRLQLSPENLTLSSDPPLPPTTQTTRESK